MWAKGKGLSRFWVMPVLFSEARFQFPFRPLAPTKVWDSAEFTTD